MLLDAETRKKILTLYYGGQSQKQVAAALALPVELVADVLDGRL